MNNSEVLKYALENGMIDLDTIQKQVEMNKRRELLEKHPYQIWQSTKGSWYTYLPDEKKGRVQRSRHSKKEIEDVIVAYQKQQIENPAIKTVFNEWNDRRLELGKISMGTYQRNKQIFKRHCDSFGNRRIRSVSVEEIAEFLENQIPKYNLSAKAFSNLKTIFRGFLKRAKRLKYITFNAEDVFNELDTSEADFKKNIKEDSEEVFDEYEMPRVMDYLMKQPDMHNLGLLLTFVTGLRVGELAALMWQDVDDISIRVRRTESRYFEKGKGVYGIKEFPKTAAGIRTIAIPNDYLWILKRVKLMNPFGEYVFMINGKRMNSYRFRNRLKLVCEKTGCVQKSPHKIRKTYGTILLDNHIDNRMVIGQMGHTDILCTEKHYHRNRRNIESKAMILNSIPEFQLNRKVN